MVRKFSRMVMLATLISTLISQVHSQERIRFRRGMSSATVNTKLTSRTAEKSCLLGASRDQTLSIETKIRNSDVEFVNIRVVTPSGDTLISAGRDRIRLRLPESGTYRVELTPPGTFYRMNVGSKSLTVSLFIQIYQ